MHSLRGTVLGVVLVAAAVATARPALSQTETPPPTMKVTARGVVTPGEQVSLRRDMTWAEALDALQRAGHTTIVYPKSGDKPIGVTITNKPWREALDILMGASGVQLAERDGYFEIVTPAGGGPSAPAPKFSLSSRQVLIDATFFSANRTVIKELGIDWTGAVGGVATYPAGVAKGVSQLFDSLLTGAHGVSNAASQVGDPSITLSGAHDFEIGDRSYRIEAVLKALDSKNLGKIIASPQITVVDGKEGKVSIGQDFATTTTDFAGNPITRFQSTGIIMTVIPHVYQESGVNFIHLEIKTERSSLVNAADQVIDKTAADTEVLLFDGEETAMAGLVQAENKHARRGVPILKDLPPWFLGLRYLFGYDRRDVVDNELIILLRAQLVPTIEERIAAKLDGRPGAVLRDTREQLQNRREGLLEEEK